MIYFILYLLGGVLFFILSVVFWNTNNKKIVPLCFFISFLFFTKSLSISDEAINDLNPDLFEGNGKVQVVKDEYILVSGERYNLSESVDIELQAGDLVSFKFYDYELREDLIKSIKIKK